MKLLGAKEVKGMKNITAVGEGVSTISKDESRLGEPVAPMGEVKQEE